MSKKKKTDPSEIRLNLLQAEVEMNAAVLERSEPIRSVLLGLLSRQHVLLFGLPGVGKSYLTDLIQRVVVGSERFAKLLNRAMAPDELFGMYDISRLDAGEYVRLDAGGTIRTAHIAFLDEIWKCNSTVLNALLGVLNERKYHNGTAGVEKVPLISCVGASNEYAQGDELAALEDRFVLRHWIDPLADQPNWLELVLGGDRPQVTTTITLAELEAAQAEVAAVKLPRDLVEPLLSIRAALEEHGVQVSDRRWRACMGPVRAQAWLAGRTEAVKADLMILRHALWRRWEGEGKTTVKNVVFDVCAPQLKEVLSMVDMAKDQLALLQSYRLSDDVTRGQVNEAKAKLSECVETIRRLAPDAGADGARQLAEVERLNERASEVFLQAAW